MKNTYGYHTKIFGMLNFWMVSPVLYRNFSNTVSHLNFSIYIGYWYAFCNGIHNFFQYFDIYQSFNVRIVTVPKTFGTLQCYNENPCIPKKNSIFGFFWFDKYDISKFLVFSPPLVGINFNQDNIREMFLGFCFGRKNVG